MKSSKFIMALMLVAVCTGAVSCNGDDNKTSRKATYVTTQDEGTTKEKKNDYVPVSIEGLDVLYTGWIKMPTGKEYITILNSPNERYENGFAYANFPAEVYKEEGEWLLIKTNDKVGYIPKTNFTTEEPEKEGKIEN